MKLLVVACLAVLTAAMPSERPHLSSPHPRPSPGSGTSPAASASTGTNLAASLGSGTSLATALNTRTIPATSPRPRGGEFCGNVRNTAFGAGEKLTYRVGYVVAGVNLNGGVATFNTSLEKYRGKSVYHIVAEGKSTHDLFYKVRDKYETYIDTNTLQPYKFIRDVSEGGYKTAENVSFYKSTHTAITNSGVYKVPSCVQDVVSAIFYARNIDYDNYRVNDTIPFDMFLDRQVYHMHIRYLGKTTIKTKYGKFHAIKFKPLLVKGNMFEGGEKMTVWVTDDPNHIAIRIESPVAVGKVAIDMTDADNLRYPLSSLIKR